MLVFSILPPFRRLRQVLKDVAEYRLRPNRAEAGLSACPARGGSLPGLCVGQKLR